MSASSPTQNPYELVPHMGGWICRMHLEKAKPTPYQCFHKQDLGALIFSFLSPQDQKNLSQADKTWYRAKIHYETRGYSILKNTARSQPIALLTSSGIQQEHLLRVLGQGGCKRAIELQNHRALMLPNMNVDPLINIAMRWKRIVHEETAMSQLLQKVGLLSPLLQRANLLISSDSYQGIIPTYLTETFESFSRTNGWFIIDINNPEGSTWKRGEHFLFHSDEERLNEANWDPLMQSLLTDIAKICLHAIPLGENAVNIAITQNPTYEIRFFGFDFSSKHKSLRIPNPEATPSINPDFFETQVSSLLKKILLNVFLCEFNCNFADAKFQQIEPFLCQLIAKYQKIILQEKLIGNETEFLSHVSI